ncbi:hypothetical protein FANTH_10010 [Fusarium anthophilum]|uniref:protein S-acyltransferase n=1 Tax=Fusarium anthophilum TaxID=48485 RepID=A0A8H4Z2Z6_9HYPO|nr:hypothetical protein FANTH_10010 [Fusarium anthophilum]
MSDPQKYTVGWICAITTEFVAAQAFLDEKHANLSVAADNDDNNYAMGKIGEHNVVMAVLPKSDFGVAPAATVARNMVRSFPNIRFGLMVGIGGGAPSAKHDIRLGDVVVSARSSGKGGVFQYDYGKAIQEHAFEATGFLNQPPQLLLTALSGLEAKYELDGHQLSNNIENIPTGSTDLTLSIKGQDACDSVCSNDPACLVDRKQRDDEEDDPAIHYGLIASANQLMKDAIARDKLSASMDILCFEMEATGLMNHFPCLVIRGICDYADSHKNKQWQGFAAMMAAAYAKDLLCQVVPSRVEAERRISDILSGFQEIAQEHRDVSKEHRDIAKEQLQAQKDLAKKRLSEEQQKCHQLLRLATGSKDATYEWYKGRVEERVEGTCMWFLKHDHFQTWLNQESGPLLVSADPGCGKSVLAKYLIDYGLPRSATICYFFFKDQDQNTVRQALCALLHQLFSLKPSLIEHAMPQFREDGQGLVNSTESLWKILRNSIRDSRAGPVIVVLDALDECAESELADLMWNVESQFRKGQLNYGKLKYFLTCRPYNQILSRFRALLDAFPNIHIPGEAELETISQEEATQRTYLWVYLVFDYLQKHDFKKTPKGIESAFITLPKSVYEAYEQILSKTNGDSMVRKVLNIILAARRPLTLSEMNVAVNIDDKSQSVGDLDLEDDEDFKMRLRSQSRELLLADSTSLQTTSSELHWHHSFTIRHAHAVLAKLCVLYLSFFNSNPFLNYSAETWGAHFRKAAFRDDDGVVPFALGICDTGSKSYSVWFDIYWRTLRMSTIPWFPDLVIASYYGHYIIVKLLLDKGAEAEAKDSEYGRTPLLWASRNGYEGVVQLLVERGAKVEARDSKYGQTPLSWAAKNGHAAFVKLLLDKGASTESKDKYGQTPLVCAVRNGQAAIVTLLLDEGASTESKDKYGRTPLLWAAKNGHAAVVTLLLDKGASIESKDKDGQTPLSLAVENGREGIVKLLLDKGADVDVKDTEYGLTPLSLVAMIGHAAVITLLLDKGASIESKDKDGQTPLSLAVMNGHAAIVTLLLDKDAEVDAKESKYGLTPLSLAAMIGHAGIVKLLLDKGAET